MSNRCRLSVAFGWQPTLAFRRSHQITVTAGVVMTEDLHDLLVAAEGYQDRAYNREGGHYQMALRLKRSERLLGVPVIVTTSIVGTAIFATLQRDASVGWKIATGVISIAAAALAALQTFFNYGGDAQRHEVAAVGYARLWRQLHQFRLKYSADDYTRPDALESLAKLVDQMDSLEEKSPRITNRVWKGIKQGSSQNASGAPPQ
jgi:hypothetical protein